MSKEVSCGAILFRESNGIRNYLLLHYESGYWDFAKGRREKGESEKETTIREVHEETGINDLTFIDNFKKKINWFYKRGGETIFKEVTYFLCETEIEEVKICTEHIGYIWLNYEDAVKKATFKDSKKLLEEAENFIKNKGPTLSFF